MNDKVLIVIGYTDFKWYARPLFPRIFRDLTYKNKDVLMVQESNYPGLIDLPSGDVVCARVREYGIERAVQIGADWVFFLDIDAIPDKDILERLLAVGHPFVGGTIACRGDSTKIIGHSYGSFEKLDRIPLNFTAQNGVKDVDGISGALMLVHKSIFSKADYSGYDGVHSIEGRTTCDDEYYCIKVRRMCGVRPKLDLSARAWHLHTDGFAYRWYGEKRSFKREKHSILFGGQTYE